MRRARPGFRAIRAGTRICWKIDARARPGFRAICLTFDDAVVMCLGKQAFTRNVGCAMDLKKSHWVTKSKSKSEGEG